MLGVFCTLCALAFAASAPTQLHIAFAGQEIGTGMTVSWRTDANVSSVVLIGETSGQYDRNFTGISRRYMYYDGFGGYHHHTTLSGLQPATKYFYIAGSGPTNEASSWSTEHHFVTADPNIKSFNVSLVGDWGFGERGFIPSLSPTISISEYISASSSSEKNCGYSTKKSLDKLYPTVDWTWMLGDIAYADDAFITEEGSLFHFKYEALYDAFMEWASDLSAEKPMMVLPGNHEAECHSPVCVVRSALRAHLANFTSYQARWQMPSKESDGVLNMWYSFDYGNVHFVSINSETDFDGAPEQGPGGGPEDLFDGASHVWEAGFFAPNGSYREWLENDLKKAHANRAQRPWVIVGAHRPVVGNGGSKNTPAWTDFILPFLEKYEVDAYVNGHVHGYISVMPAHDNPIKFPKAYITTGGAGNVEMPSACPKSWFGAGSEFSNLTCAGYPEACSDPHEEPLFSAEDNVPGNWTVGLEDYGDNYGTVMMRVHNDTHITFDYVHSETGEIVDSNTIVWDH